MSRWKAATIHLVLSALIIGTLAATMIATWYGWELFQVSGGKRLLGILAACDIVIGPLLTLIVYKAGKKSLKFDLTVIALLQAAFFLYGLNVMRESRPIFLVAVLDRFELVFNNELGDDDLAKGSKPEFRQRSLSGPRMIGGVVAQNSKEMLDLALSGFAGRDVQLLPERYTDYDSVASQIAAKAKPVAELIGNSTTADAGKLERAVKAAGLSENEIVFVPINSRRGQATMLLVASTGKVLGPVAANPWPDAPTE